MRGAKRAAEGFLQISSDRNRIEGHAGLWASGAGQPTGITEQIQSVHPELCRILRIAARDESLLCGE